MSQNNNSQKSHRYDTIFIGAGVAALTAARELMDLGQDDVLILEQGKFTPKRSCPGESTSTCFQCKLCDTTIGLGGANALHGNKVCFFPASEGVLDLIGREWQSVIAERLKRYFPLHLSIGLKTQHKIKHSALKGYPSDALSKKHFREFVKNLSGYLILSKKIVFQSKVTAIHRSKNGFQIDCKDKTYFTKKLVWAAGRAGSLQSQNIFDFLGVEYASPCPDIGFRIETHRELFNELYYYQVDPKIKRDYDDLGSARTFCAHNQGHVVPVLIDKGFYADGAFLDNFGDSNNIAIMCRTKATYDTKKIDEWCHSINKKYKNHLLLSEFTLEASQIPTSIYRGLEQLSDLLPSKQHRGVFDRFVHELTKGELAIFKKQHAQPLPFRVYGPAVDYYWVQPKVDENLQTNIPGFYVIGDSIGLSRGYYQAMFSGAAFAFKQFQSFSDRKILCSNLALQATH